VPSKPGALSDDFDLLALTTKEGAPPYAVFVGWEPQNYACGSDILVRRF
jgi:hypothetical protein